MEKRTYLKKVMLGIMVLGILLFVPKMQASAADCISLEGNNEGWQSYSYYSKPIYSYLSYDGNQTLMKVSVSNSLDGVLVEYYDMNFKLISNKVVPKELKQFGGFYATASNYYLVTGQNNLSEDPSVEVFRITKYDKSWNRITSVGLFDCNTTVPFDAGTVRFAESGKWLLIRTAHEMYQSTDGKNHQANVTIQLDTESMIITDSATDVSNVWCGYVSHSFNQFIEIENNQIVAVDHGDAYPRSIALIKYPGDVATGRFYQYDCDYVDVLEIMGRTGDNRTGATVGGFEIASDHYLIAGNSIVQDEQYASRRTRNIFLSAVSKTDDTVTTRWLTNFAEGEESASTPHLVKISNDSYLLLWAREGSVYYVKINGAGEQVGSIYSMEGGLSDCKPILVNGNIVWYTWSDETITFYQISASNPAESSTTQVVTGHKYEYRSSNNGYASFKCTNCGETKEIELADYIYVWWRDKDDDSFGDLSVDLYRNVNQTWYCRCSIPPRDKLVYDCEMESSDPNVIEIDKSEDDLISLTAKKPGTATISFWPKYNPDVKETFTFKVFPEGTVPVRSIYFDWSYVSLELGKSIQLNPSVTPENATNKKLTYKSSDESIATVSESGLVTAVSPGYVTIAATTQDGTELTAYCNISAWGYIPEDNTPEYNTSTPQNGWKTESDGTKYWYENGIRQGTEGRGKEIYDPASDAWYWLDAPDGKMAYSKDVYQESLAGDWGDYIGADGQRYGKWVRYDANGHMIKGWQTNENGTYFFDYIYGTMAKGYATIDGIEYYFDPATGILERQIAEVPEMGWMNIDGIDYWYENHVRQGYSVDRSYRGKEIYDSGSDAWYWLDNIDNGKKATGKDVYQESLAGDWGDIVGADGQRYGKWVRYDENGHMIKGWQTNENGTYFFDYTYGTMAKGHVTIEGQSYYFDEVTGVLR